MTDTLEQLLRDELAPDLEVMRMLGHGSVASVYLAREPALKRLVAVKVLRPDVASQDVARRRFEREAQAAARLNHRNLTDIYRVGRLTQGLPFIVMEFVDGRNLADALKARGPMTPDEVRHVVLGVASALAEAHANGIIHRDVRPGNVIREENTERIVLTDFGIAALLETGGESSTQLTTMGHHVGELRYMSPEQLRGEALTVQADVYSLGIMGYVLLTGDGPFPGGRAAEVTQKLHGDPRPLRELRPGVDAHLATLLEGCLARNPDHRPSAADIKRALTQPAGSLPARPPVDDTALGAFMRELKRRRVYTVGAAYLAFAVVVLGILDAISEPLGIPGYWQRVLILLTLGGFPVTLSLAWIFDVREGRVTRTAAEAGALSGRRLVLPVIGLAVAVLVAILVGIRLLR